MPSPDPVPDADSPFASFAEPKKSPVEEYRERAAQERQGSAARWSFVGLALVGTVFGAVAGVGSGVGVEPLRVPLALGYAIGCAVGGMLAGWVAGMTMYGLPWFRSMMPAKIKPVRATTMATTQWDGLTIWLALWTLVGIASGAAVGAMLATAPPDRATAEVGLAWGMGGASAGLAAAIAGWFLLRRATTKAPAPD